MPGPTRRHFITAAAAVALTGCIEDSRIDLTTTEPPLSILPDTGDGWEQGYTTVLSTLPDGAEAGAYSDYYHATGHYEFKLIRWLDHAAAQRSPDHYGEPYTVRVEHAYSFAVRGPTSSGKPPRRDLHDALIERSHGL